MEYAWQKFGTKKWAELVGPSAELASKGYALTDAEAQSMQSAARGLSPNTYRRPDRSAHAKSARRSRGCAATCSVVIDQIEPGPSAEYARVYGRFEAKAALPDGLPQNVKGAFLADFPIDR